MQNQSIVVGVSKFLVFLDGRCDTSWNYLQGVPESVYYRTFYSGFLNS